MAGNGKLAGDDTRQLGLKDRTPDGNGKTPRTYTQEEFGAQQSTYEKREKDLKTELATLKTNYEGLQREHAKLKAAHDVLKAEVDEPYTDDGARTAAQKIRDREVTLKTAEAELAVIQEQFKGTLEEARTAKVSRWAQEVSEWTLGKVEVKDLTGYGSKAEMLEHVSKNLDLKTITSLESKDKTPAPKETQPRIHGTDSPSGGGEHLSPHEKIVRGLEEENNE
jgi:hypothetical protein